MFHLHVYDAENSYSRVIEHTDTDGMFDVIFLEVDEHQQEYRILSCEVSWMSKIFEILAIHGSTLPIRFIRYNPHSFNLNNEICRTTQKQKNI